MILKIPDYYDTFRCIAGACQHTCCASWEIDIDDDSYHAYLKIEGEFGEKLKKSIKHEKTTYFRMLHGKCPLLDKNHLCEVYQKLGEAAMCKVCTEYPRESNHYYNTSERILALSCEEASRILYTKTEPIQFITKEMKDDDIFRSDQSREYKNENSILDSNQIENYVAIRDYCIDVLQDRSVALKSRICHFLRISSNVQAYLNQGELGKYELDIEQSIMDIDNPVSHNLFQQRMDVVMGMEIMEDEWLQEMNNVLRAFHSDSHAMLYKEIYQEFEKVNVEYEYQYEHFIVYLAYRYLIDARKDGRFLLRAKFCVLCYLHLRDMDQMRYLLAGKIFTLKDRIENTRILCKQVEHSKKSMEYLFEQLTTSNIFSIDNLIKQI